MASTSNQCCPLLASKKPFSITAEYIAYRVRRWPIVNEGWTEDQWRDLANVQAADGYEAALQSVNVSEGVVTRSLPPELCHNILNLAVMSLANDRKKTWDAIHHTLQPCSVCGKLVAVDVDDNGDIISTGTYQYSRHVVSQLLPPAKTSLILRPSSHERCQTTCSQTSCLFHGFRDSTCRITLPEYCKSARLCCL